MYNIKSLEKVENDNHGMQFHNQPRRNHNRFNDPHELLLPNSPHPSEITTSSNSDSGIGFHNDINIVDRCFVVDIPESQNRNLLIQNKNLHLHRQRRPLGIVNDYQLSVGNDFQRLQDVHLVQNQKLSSPQPSTSGIFHAKSKSADYDYTSMEKLAIRAMPVRNVLPPSSTTTAVKSIDSFEANKCDHHPRAVEDVWYDGEMLDEDGNEIHERPVDVPNNSFKLNTADANEFHKMMIQSCDDILMIMNKENDDKDAKKDDHVFTVPAAKPQKRCSKKSLTLLGKSKSSNYDPSKSKLESNLKHYKLSPKVFGLPPRPVSMSVENLSSSSSIKRRSLFGGSKKKESKPEEKEVEEFEIWGSLQELRNSDNLKTHQCITFLEGTYSEPNLCIDEVSLNPIRTLFCLLIFKTA